MRIGGSSAARNNRKKELDEHPALEGRQGKDLRWRYGLKPLVLGTLLLAGILALTSGYWLRALGGSLVYKGRFEISQAILIENFDPDYLLFERTSLLMREGRGGRVFVLAPADRDGARAGTVPEGIVEVMARVARIPQLEIIPVREIEPISLNAGLQARDFLQNKNIRSVIIVTSGFRSRRSFLIWDAVLRPAGIRVSCCPVFGLKTPDNWHLTWHGRQDVIMEAAKLLYYRLYVLPSFRRHSWSRVSDAPIGRASGIALAA